MDSQYKSKSFITVKGYKKQLSTTDQWIKKLGYISSMEDF